MPTGHVATSSSGLSSAEAAARLAANGPNRLPPPPAPRGRASSPASSSTSSRLMLWVAACWRSSPGMPQLGVAIFVVVVVNGVFAFVQEQRAEHAAERLRICCPVGVDRASATAHRSTIDAADARRRRPRGARRPAIGCRPTSRRSRPTACRVDTSTLTGESVPVPLGVGDRRCSPAPSSSQGEADGVVTRIGADTGWPASPSSPRAAHRPPQPARPRARPRRAHRRGRSRSASASRSSRSSLAARHAGHATASCSPSASPSRSSPRVAPDGHAVAGDGRAADGRAATRSCAGSRRSRRSARRRSSAPTRPAR